MKVWLGNNYESGQLFGPDMLEDPYPIYRRLRTQDPIHWDKSLNAWVLTRYEDVAWAISEPALSSDRISPARKWFQGERVTPPFDLFAKLLGMLDEPDHTRIRMLIHKAFTRTTFEQWTKNIQRHINTLLNPARKNGEMDFVRDFAIPLPILVISEILGIPKEDRDRVKAWCDQFSMVAGNFYTHLSPERLEQGLIGIQEFKDYLEEQVAQVSHTPRHDLLTSLVHIEEKGDRLTFDELVANVVLILNGASESTTCLLGNGLAALLQNPEQYERLKNEPSFIPNAIEEFLRYESPFQYTGRVAMKDIEREGHLICQGDLVLALWGAANRDPAHFPNPDKLDVTRQPIAHLAFGYGHHFCIGAQLARLEARLAFTTLLSDFKTIELKSSQLQHDENFVIRGYKSLPLRLSA